MEEFFNIVNNKLVNYNIVLKNPGGGESVILGLTANSIVYKRGNSKLYYSKKIFYKTFAKNNGKGWVYSLDLKKDAEVGKYYRNKPCHCTFFMMLMNYIFGVKIEKNPHCHIKFNIKMH